MSESPILPVDKKTWNKWSFYINGVIFIIVAVFIYLLFLDALNAGKVYGDNYELTNALIAVMRDVAFLAVGLVILFVQMFNYYRQLSRRSW
jgi:L-asparagine transporter-like permease